MLVLPSCIGPYSSLKKKKPPDDNVYIERRQIRSPVPVLSRYKNGGSDPVTNGHDWNWIWKRDLFLELETFPYK